MVKHGANHSAATVAKPRLDIRHLIDGDVQIPMVMDGRILLQIGWQVQEATAMHGLLIQHNGMTKMVTVAVIIHKEQPLTYVQTMQVHLLVQ